MSYSIDIDEYDVLDNMGRAEVLEWLKIKEDAPLPQHVQKLLELDLTLPDLIELDRWMATKRKLPLKPVTATLTAPPKSAEASGQAQLSPGR